MPTHRRGNLPFPRSFLPKLQLRKELASGARTGPGPLRSNGGRRVAQVGVSSSGKREAVRIAGLGFAWAGLAGSLVFWVNFVLFLANQPNLTGRTIDGAGHASLLVAGFINAVLIALFGLQHSLMARESVKRSEEHT